MPDNDDLRMNQNETLNCKLALMGVWTEACVSATVKTTISTNVN